MVYDWEKLPADQNGLSFGNLGYLGVVYILLFFFFFLRRAAQPDLSLRRDTDSEWKSPVVTSRPYLVWKKFQKNHALCALINTTGAKYGRWLVVFVLFLVLYKLVEGGQDNFTRGRMAFSFVPTRMSMCSSCFVVKRILSVFCAFLFAPSARSDGHFWWWRCASYVMARFWHWMSLAWPREDLHFFLVIRF